MTIGTSILLIAVGAILKFAITTHVSGVNIQTIGLIIMLAGIVGLVIALLYTFVWADRRRAPVAEREREYDAPTRVPPRDRY